MPRLQRWVGVRRPKNKKKGNVFRAGIFLDCVRLTTRAGGTHGGGVHRTRGEPTEMDVAAINPLSNGPFVERPLRAQ